MSLDVYLEIDGGPPVDKGGSGIFIRENGKTREISREEWNKRFPDREPVVALPSKDGKTNTVFHANITHNLNQMADAAGIYAVLWRPNEHGVTEAAQLIEPLRVGLQLLKAKPEHFKQFNPPNGWGDYDGFVEFVAEYLRACETWPSARVEVWR